MDSILESVKKLLGSGEGYEYFDPDIIMQINSVFSTLRQIGVGPKDGFAITSSEEVWTDFTTDKTVLGIVKPYVSMKVKLAFDPPQSSFVLDSYNKQIAEAEWRLSIQVDPGWGGI